MLHVVGSDGSTCQWQVGHPKFEKSMLRKWHVCEVRASGEELKHVETFFSHLPARWVLGGPGPDDVVSWFGDHAKFIAFNL